MVNPMHQTPQGQSVAKPGTPRPLIMLIENLNMTGVRMSHVESYIQRECPETETHRKVCICRTRTT